MPRIATRPEDPNYLLALAYNERDLDLAATLYEDGSVTRRLPQDGGDPVAGVEVLAALIRSAEGSSLQMALNNLVVTRTDDLALLRSEWSVFGEAADGTPVALTHSGTEVTRRQSDGTWKFILDHPWGGDGGHLKHVIPPLPSFDD